MIVSVIVHVEQNPFRTRLPLEPEIRNERSENGCVQRRSHNTINSNTTFRSRLIYIVLQRGFDKSCAIEAFQHQARDGTNTVREKRQ